MSQLLLNTINQDVLYRVAQIAYEQNRRLAVEQLEDNSVKPWKLMNATEQKAVVDKVRYLMDNGFPTPKAFVEAMGAEDDQVAFFLQMFRACVMSILGTWSGSPQMGPQMPPLPYEPEPEPEPEPAKEEPKQEPKPDPVEVVDGSDEEVNEEAGGEPSEEGAGGAEETSDESSEDSTPKPSSKSRKK